ncbi:MAG: hypothetical protein WC879_01360 [Melioribacteraceae bacterium]
MNYFLEQLDVKLNSMMNSSVMLKNNYPKNFSEIEVLPFKSHSELVDSVQTGNALIIQGLGDISMVAFFLLANKTEKRMQNFYLWLPFLIAGIFLISSFILSNYFFFIGIILPFIAGTFSSNYLPFKKSAPIFVFVILIIAYFLNLPTISILSFGYLINHYLLVKQKQLYLSVLLSRAIELESAFIFLFGGKLINVLNRNYETYTWQ